MGTKPLHAIVTLSGTGSGWASAELPIREGHAARLLEIRARQAAGGGATSMALYIVHSDTAVSATPDELLTVYRDPSAALMASATVASVSDPVAEKPLIRGDIGKQVAVNVTGSGAWTIYVYVDYERGF
jgi:archaellum component FlaG (FlaF/FlaG flagellin family)